MRCSRELQEEANRIRHYDSLTQPEPRGTVELVNWVDIDAELKTTKDRLSRFKYAVQKADLKEDVGVLTADDIVPATLHGVLCRELGRLASAEPKDLHPGSFGKVSLLALSVALHPRPYPVAGSGLDPSVFVYVIIKNENGL